MLFKNTALTQPGDWTLLLRQAVADSDQAGALPLNKHVNELLEHSAEIE